MTGTLHTGGRTPQRTGAQELPVFTGWTFAETAAWCAAQGWPGFRAAQLWDWVYRKNAADGARMSNLSREMRAELSRRLVLMRTHVITTHTSSDRSEKRLIGLPDGEAVESVWIPMGAHATVCVSTQVGCPIRCAFCASGSEGYTRNLAAGEIVEQVLHAQHAHARAAVNNVVFMGMGEPLLNYDQFIRAVAILNDEHGMHIGARRMTVSTTGVIPGIRQLAHDAPQMNLAISLHATHDALRRRLIAHCPSTIFDLMRALEAYHRATGRDITFEYVLLAYVNDSQRDAQQLAALAHRVPSKVNVIPYNPVFSNEFQAPTEDQTAQFLRQLEHNQVHALVRRRKGVDINAACGQLRRLRGAAATSG
ncbi:23S rRNA (adenine(2503)-C(2))-methyltransferase RlmN [bacterium]|nr:23S rRNA (adenine(2503)-C(2))-methyltransferase RlmN [bacterium]